MFYNICRCKPFAQLKKFHYKFSHHFPNNLPGFKGIKSHWGLFDGISPNIGLAVMCISDITPLTRRKSSLHGLPCGMLMIKQGCVETQREAGKMQMTPRYSTQSEVINICPIALTERVRKVERKEEKGGVGTGAKDKERSPLGFGVWRHLCYFPASNRTPKHSDRATAKVIQNPAVPGCRICF